MELPAFPAGQIIGEKKLLRVVNTVVVIFDEFEHILDSFDDARATSTVGTRSVNERTRSRPALSASRFGSPGAGKSLSFKNTPNWLGCIKSPLVLSLTAAVVPGFGPVAKMFSLGGRIKW